MKKYYLLHPCFSLALSSAERGKLIENLVAFKTKADYYWREREKEIDFILKKNILPVEVKYKQQMKKKELKHLIYFMENFKVKKALMVTDDKEGEETIKGKKIMYISLWKWLLQ